MISEAVAKLEVLGPAIIFLHKTSVIGGNVEVPPTAIRPVKCRFGVHLAIKVRNKGN